MVQLRTGHSRLRHHIYMLTKFCIGESAVCHCGTSPMMVGHFLQDCQTHQNLIAETWPADTPVREKIYGPVENLSIQQHKSELPEFLSERTSKKKKKKKKKSICCFKNKKIYLLNVIKQLLGSVCP